MMIPLDNLLEPLNHLNESKIIFRLVTQWQKKTSFNLVLNLYLVVNQRFCSYNLITAA